jgi:hypothetical protein
MSSVFPAFLHTLCVGDFDADHDNVGVLLIDESFEFDESALAVDDVAGAEISGNGYQREIVEVTTERDGTSLRINLGGMSWEPASINAAGAIYFKDDGDDSQSTLIAHVAFDRTVRTVSGLLQLTPSAILIEVGQ